MKLIYILLVLLTIPLVAGTEKEETSITIIKEDTQNNNMVRVSAILRGEDGRQINNEIITFYVVDNWELNPDESIKVANRITDENGSSYIELQYKDNKYSVQVRFDGSNEYKESESEVIIIEKENIETEKLPNQIFILISILTLGVAGSLILYVLSKNKKRFT